jgi:hypothetical protein
MLGIIMNLSAYYNDVNDWLTIGGDLHIAADQTGQTYAEIITELRDRGVTQVIDLREEWNDRAAWVQMGFPTADYRYAPIVDVRGYTPEEDWFRTVEEAFSRFWHNSYEGDRMYVHCHMGINRAPSVGMLALLTVNPEMHPFEAFLQIREARPIAGVRYAEAVGIRHLLNVEGVTDVSKGMPASVTAWREMLDHYWTPERREEHGDGIAYYRSIEGTLVIA